MWHLGSGCFWTEHIQCFLHASQIDTSMSQTKKATSLEATDAAAAMQDNVPLSEMDKAAVLTLIREEVLLLPQAAVNLTMLTLLKLTCLLYVLFSNQIITKEIEVNEWKRKYEESRTEVFEMRYDLHCHFWLPAKINISVLLKRNARRRLSFIVFTGK